MANRITQYYSMSLQKPVHQQLLVLQREITKDLGFEPTLTQIIQLLLHHYRKTHDASGHVAAAYRGLMGLGNGNGDSQHERL